MYFPDEFRMTGKQLKTNIDLLKKLRSDVEDIIEHTDISKKKRESANKDFLKHLNPDSWNIRKEGNQEIKFEVDFNMYLMRVCQDLNLNKWDVSVFEFFSGVTLLKQQAKKD